MKRTTDKRARQEAAGIPDSRPFNAPDETYPENPVLDCHVGGVRVRDLPVEMQTRILFQQTDEGIAESNRGKSDSGVGIARDGVDKKLDERRDDLRAGKDPRFAQSPIRFLDNFKRPGFKQKLLTTKNGEVNPDYQVIKKENGDPLRYKGMVVGEIPEETARERNQFYQDRSATRLAALTEQVREKEKLIPTEV